MEKWIERLIFLFSANRIKGKVSCRAGRACTQFARTHHGKAIRAWNQGTKTWYKNVN